MLFVTVFLKQLLVFFICVFLLIKILFVKHIAILVFIFLLFSCGAKNEENSEKNITKPLMSVEKKHPKTVDVKPVFLKEVENWGSLKLVDSFFVKYRKISPREALNNALELKDLIKKLKDTIKPEFFDTPSFSTRVNILYNEALRLTDLIDISAIQADEVNLQVDKTMEAFSAVNIKINTILLSNKFEDEIEIDVSYIGLDTTKIDTVSKKTIDARLKKKLLDKTKLKLREEQ